jgi:hypothetical protein
MKLHILYNDTGDLSAICHVENPGGKFLPGKGQHTAILTIPSELEGLKPHELHRAVRVDTKKQNAPPCRQNQRVEPKRVMKMCNVFLLF